MYVCMCVCTNSSLCMYVRCMWVYIRICMRETFCALSINQRIRMQKVSLCVRVWVCMYRAFLDHLEWFRLMRGFRQGGFALCWKTKILSFLRHIVNHGGRMANCDWQSVSYKTWNFSFQKKRNPLPKASHKGNHSRFGYTFRTGEMCACARPTMTGNYVSNDFCFWFEVIQIRCQLSLTYCNSVTPQGGRIT